MCKISYCVTVCNETEDFIKLMDVLIHSKRSEDNILILVDTNKATPDLEDALIEFTNTPQIYIQYQIFWGNFADWKNIFWTDEFFNPLLKDYLFFLDADERPDPELISNIPYILDINPEVEVYGVPRSNFVIGITDEYINSVGWRKDEQNRINYPDYQYRICQNNDNLRWGGKVHETIQGYQIRTELPMNDVYGLLHIKSFEKQIKQNKFYESI